ncbi:MAG: TonB-dependent receptor [Bacteriovoracaceae bacterium]|nr:TonB-dependent receptor [Bacteriovoracaceae bacterium]
MKLILFFLLSLPVFAQTTSTSTEVIKVPSAPAANNSGFERVEVTGSHIRKIDVQGVAPLDTISSDEFLKSGSIEVGQVLREDPAFEAVYGNVGHVRFRGQHAGNVLILLNGLRMPKLNGGYYTSVRNLPTSAINRIEMLKDGGSAVYGSDAMSGVMNFITKTDFDGANIGLSTSVPETGLGVQRNVEGTFGKNFARGNIMGVFQYENTDGFLETDVGSINRGSGLAPVKTSNLTLGQGSGALKVGPTCATGVCETDPLIFDQSQPDNEDISALLTGAYSFGDTKVAVLGLYNRKNVTRLENPLTLDWTNNSSKGGANNAIDFSQMSSSPYRTDIANAGIVNNGFVDIKGNLVDELGDYLIEAKENNYNLQASVSGFIGLDWDWKVLSGYSVADFEETVLSGEADQNKLREMFLEGRFNILANQGAKSNLEEASINPVYRNKGTMFTNKLIFSGELFDLGNAYENGGLVSMAVGTEYQTEDFAFNNDQSLVDGSSLARTTRNFSGSRSVRSAFVEFSIFPVTELEVQVAGRFDSYSDVGNTTNPKLAVAYRPIKEVLFRSSVATGFRAPGITDIYAGEEQAVTRLRDAVDCTSNGNCGSSFYDVTTYTTPEIAPENAMTYSFGTVIQPYKRTTLSIDQWNFDGENTLTALNAGDYTELEAQQGAAALASVGAQINRDVNGKIESVRMPRVVNLGQRTLRGVDVSLNSDFDLGRGFDLMAGSGMSFIFERSQQRFTFEQREENPDSWKNRAYLGLRNDYHFMRVTMLTVSKQLVGRGAFQETLPQYSEFDFSYGYTANWGGRFNFSVKNLANTRPPAQNDDYVTFGNPDRNYSSFSPLRRRVYVSYSQTF